MKMKIQVKLFPTLKGHAPPGAAEGERFPLEMEAVCTGETVRVRDVILRLRIPVEEVGMAIVNGNIEKDLDLPLQEGDVVFLSPLVSGG